MGTNYYVEQPCCPTCGRASEVHHIGLSSMGWAFVFRGYREQGLTSAKAWFEYLKDKQIVDEYGCKHSMDDFRVKVASKKSDRIWSGSRKELDDEGHPFNFYDFS